jgi:hypothetical protein
VNILHTFSLQIRCEKFVAHYVLAPSVGLVAFLEATTERKSLEDFQMYSVRRQFFTICRNYFIHFLVMARKKLFFQLTFQKLGIHYVMQSGAN